MLRYFRHITADRLCCTFCRRIASTRESFHKSWFESVPQSDLSSQEAKYDHTLQEQTKSLHTNGFTIIKRSQYQLKSELNALNTEVLDELQSIENSYYYKINRYFGLTTVRASEKRHAIPLPMTTRLLTVVSRSINSVRSILQTQLTEESPLVELSAIISLPGSERQTTHSDISFSTSEKIITGFVALSSIKLVNGPTCLFAGTHTKAFHNQHVDSAILTASHYAADGSEERDSDQLESANRDFRENDNLDKNMETVNDEVAAGKELEDSVEVQIASNSLPHAAVLEIGDILVYNTQLFHFGGANDSISPRALLTFSFQQCTPWGDIDKVNGFTYHCHRSFRGKYRLKNF